MLRILALNEDVSEDSETETTVEAQESIAEAEYIRALKLKSNGKIDVALTLLNGLLETKVLNDLSDDKNERLWAIRYNCHKNIAMICEEKQDSEMALYHYILAMQIDDTDVHAMQRFGKLAMKNNALELAEFAFNKCLKKNPVHWNAIDGILKILCRNHNILGAYGLAYKILSSDRYYEFALQTLNEITIKFKCLLPYFKNMLGDSDEVLDSSMLSTMLENGSVFPALSNGNDEQNEPQNQKPTSNLSQFCCATLTWQSIGQYIILSYTHLKETEQSLFFVMNLDDISGGVNDNSNFKMNTKDQFQTESVEEQMSKTHSCGADSNIEKEVDQVTVQDTFLLPSTSVTTNVVQSSDSVNQEDLEKNGEIEPTKPKPRRRCSDLLFLEQWGWHKNRRRNKKASVQERPEADNSLNAFLRRIFGNFMINTVENSWPFDEEIPDQLNDNSASENETKTCGDCSTNITLEEFQNATEDEFTKFKEALREEPFDLMLLIYKWLKNVSPFWSKTLPPEIKTQYLTIFKFYSDHFDKSNWHMLSNSNFEASYRICLLYLELEYENCMSESRELSIAWTETMQHLSFVSGSVFVANPDFFIYYELRLANLEYLLHDYRNELEKCVLCLESIKTIIQSKQDIIVVHLPNLKTGCLTKYTVTSTCEGLRRKVSLNKVPILFEKEKWTELSEVIKYNIRNSKDEVTDSENWVKDFKIQIEVLLQALWNMQSYKECMIWSEKCLCFCTGQYLKEVKVSAYRHKLWAESINFTMSYIEAICLNEGFDIFESLDENYTRLVQNIISLVTHQLDSPFDKNNNPVHELETKRTWVILHQIAIREENCNSSPIKSKSEESEEEEEILPHSFLVLFTAHEFLGKRHWCTRDNGSLLQYTLDAITPNFRAPIYDACRDSLYEYIEQITYCLYGYPQKKARSRHLEEHDAVTVELLWPKAIQLFDLYRPENLPEFNSYKLESISADMEQLLIKIVALMPIELDPTPAITRITKFISGSGNLEEDDCPQTPLPYKINSIYYLLADYYFKCRDFSKAIKYYTLDLVGNTERVDSWAGIALSKASKIETKLNGLAKIDLSILLNECEETIRCFERCITLNRNQTLLWIEYGSFTYTLYSFCARYLKQSSENLSMEEFSSIEERKEKMLEIAYNCFSLANTLQNNADENIDTHDEKWLCQYMLGKVAEKRKEAPKVFLNYYLTAANHLYENKATYPIKLNHSNPSTLSVEALELYYRTNSAIIKYLEHEKEISREIGRLFTTVLDNLANSPFAFNKAKIDGSCFHALKRKMSDKNETDAPSKFKKDSNGEKINSTNCTNPDLTTNETTMKTDNGKLKETLRVTINLGNETNNEMQISNRERNGVQAPKIDQTQTIRRESQESALTGTTTTVTSSTTSTNVTSDSSSDSESDSDSVTPYTEVEIEFLYKVVVQNLEECITRFPEHYKSIYRLVYHYMNGPEKLRNLTFCEQLLLGQYRTTLGNLVNGLFYDRKTNNLFNGIWRIPSSEIDRPGSFSTHLVKCVSTLIQLLLKTDDYNLLIDIGLQLYKTPDNDKRYIKDFERIELYANCVNYCAQILRKNLKNNMEQRDDKELLELILDIYRIHKKCVKHMNHKEVLFTKLLVDAYKYYVQDKVENLPANLNFLDLAIKLCMQELSARKNMGKANTITSCNADANIGDAVLGLTPQIPRTIQIPGLNMRQRGRISKPQPAVTSNVNQPTVPTSAPISTDILKNPNLMSMMSLFGNSAVVKQDTAAYQRLVADYYNRLLELEKKDPNIIANLTNYPNALQTTLSLASSLPLETTITPANPQRQTSSKQVQNTKQNTDELIQSFAGSSYNSTTVITSSQSSTTPLEIKAINSVTSVANSTKGSVTDITTTNVANLTNTLTYTYSDSLIISKSYQGKAKSSVSTKAKQFQNPKAYNRQMNSQLPAAVSLEADFAQTMQNLSNIFNADAGYNQQANLLSAYVDLFKNTALPQQETLAKKPRAPAKRKPKPAGNTQNKIRKNMIEISITAASSTTSANMCNNILLQPKQDPNGKVLSSNPFKIPTFITNDITMTTVTVTTAAGNRTNTLPTFSLISNTKLPTPTYTTHHSPAATPFVVPSACPSKTLQQKLAERQKANQLIEANMPTTGTTSSKPNVDVIILE
ncbi:calcineurin-binding protein cabin-1-like [Teleopsis dalmanni]|uniref:calcineurin-binding protein cabin-1-like n=1 Tax=Teleopsis dalmanni TaxID=139649 RepID=UPI0018CF25CD|nr:calcineurin-binding protein cabin-1-like [Teleopsis dalmanni]XP_037928085.1 calcineurin-binding protein cabin-1-like [Teleopsis dalmanni]